MRNDRTTPGTGPVTLVRLGVGPVNRREFVLGGAALGGLGALGLKVRKAQAATTVIWIGWQGYDEPLYAADYLENNEITLQTTYITANEEIITKLQAGGLGKIDVASPYFGHANIMIKAGLLTPLDMGRIPNFNDVLSFFVDVDLLLEDGVRYAVPFTWGTIPLMYRADLVSEVPTSWMDVMKPEYKGKVLMCGDVIAMMATWAPVVIGQRPGTVVTPAQLKETIDFYIDMKRNQARVFTENWGEIADIFARGEAVISTCGWEPISLWAAEKGADVRYVFPKEGTMAFMDTYVIPKNAPNLDVAYGLVNQVISVEAQLKLAKDLGQAIVNGAAVPLLDEDNRKTYSYDELEKLADKGVGFVPFPPLEPDGIHATYDDMLEEWERFLKS